MAIGDIWRMTIKGEIGADDNQNVVHYQVASGGGTPEQDAAALADAWITDAKTEYLECISSVYHIQSLSIRGVTWPLVGVDVTTTGPGIQNAEVAPTQTSALLNLKTSAIGRSFMGKMYFPGLAEDLVSAGSITATLIGLLEEYASEANQVVSTTLPLTTFQWVVYSRKLLSARAITSVQVSSFAATQRRRRPGVGS